LSAPLDIAAACSGRESPLQICSCFEAETAKSRFGCGNTLRWRSPIDALVVVLPTADVLAKFCWRPLATYFPTTRFDSGDQTPCCCRPVDECEYVEHHRHSGEYGVPAWRRVFGFVELAANTWPFVGSDRPPVPWATNEAIVDAVLETLGARRILAGRTVLITRVRTAGRRLIPSRYLNEPVEWAYGVMR